MYNSGGLLPELVLLGEGLLVLVELGAGLGLLLDLFFGQSFLGLDFRDVAVRVRDLGDGLLVVALRRERVLHPLGITSTVRPGNFILVLLDDPRLGTERRREVVVVADDDDAALELADRVGQRAER